MSAHRKQLAADAQDASLEQVLYSHAVVYRCIHQQLSGSKVESV